MRLQEKFAFGKYKGKTLEYVIEIDVSYIVWLEKEKKKANQNAIVDNAEALEEYDRSLSLLDPEMQGYFTTRHDPGTVIFNRGAKAPGRRSVNRLYNDE